MDKGVTVVQKIVMLRRYPVLVCTIVPVLSVSISSPFLQLLLVAKRISSLSWFFGGETILVLSSAVTKLFIFQICAHMLQLLFSQWHGSS